MDRLQSRHVLRQALISCVVILWPQLCVCCVDFDSQIRALEPLILAVHSLLLHCTAGPLRPLMNVSCIQYMYDTGRLLCVCACACFYSVQSACLQSVCECVFRVFVLENHPIASSAAELQWHQMWPVPDWTMLKGGRGMARQCMCRGCGRWSKSSCFYHRLWNAAPPWTQRRAQLCRVFTFTLEETRQLVLVTFVNLSFAHTFINTVEPCQLNSNWPHMVQVVLPFTA